MDRDDLEHPAARRVADQLNRLIVDLADRGLRASSWYGTLHEPASEPPIGWEPANRGYDYEPLPGAADDAYYPWFLYWEIAWLVMNADFLPGQRVLDLGGSSSLFSYYLAERGLDVVTLDHDAELVSNADRVSREMSWALHNRLVDLREFDRVLDVPEPGRFDHVTSVCVFEHLPVSGRLDVSSRVGELLTETGAFSMTFDYANPSRLARIGSPDAVREQFVDASGLAVRGNPGFHDNGRRYLLHPFHHPRAESEGWKDLCIERGQFEPADRGRQLDVNEYTFGALFLRRTG
jgi:2-polyprenyl-3-methyl-5-hydroxy-6-metoxy-1,4-benzoquinol methylase